MKNFLKPHTLLTSLALCLSAIISFQALKEKGYFEIQINEKTKIKTGHCINLEQ